MAQASTPTEFTSLEQVAGVPVTPAIPGTVPTSAALPNWGTQGDAVARLEKVEELLQDIRDFLEALCGYAGVK